MGFVFLGSNQNSKRLVLLGEHIVNRFHGKKTLIDEKNKGLIPLIYKFISNLKTHRAEERYKLEVKISMLELQGHFAYDLLFNCKSREIWDIWVIWDIVDILGAILWIYYEIYYELYYEIYYEIMWVYCCLYYGVSVCWILAERYTGWLLQSETLKGGESKLLDFQKKEEKLNVLKQNNLINIIENNVGRVLVRNLTYVHIKSHDHLIETLIKSVIPISCKIPHI